MTTDIRATLLERYRELMARAEVLDEEGHFDVAESLRVEADRVLSRYAELREAKSA
jgi:hypothetical protein